MSIFFFFFFNDTATTEIYTLSLHDALPISKPRRATNSPSRLAASARDAVCRQARPSIPVQPSAPTRPRNAEAQRLWSVIAATSSPAARMLAKQRLVSPAPSDSQG